MSWITKVSIKRKLVLLIFSISLIAMLIGFTLITLERMDHARETLQNEAKANAKLIAEYAIAPIVFDDMDGLKTILEKIEIFPEVISLAVYNENEELINFYLSDPEAFRPPEKVTHENDYLQDYLHVHEPIIFNQIVYGSLHLFVSTEEMKHDLRHHVLIFFLIALVMALIVYGLASRMQGFISKPILQLSEMTRSISQQADYSLRLEKKSNDEIGELYDNFNMMIDQIEKRSRERDSVYEKLRNQYDRFLAILDAFPETVCIIDRDKLEILFANRSMEKQYNRKLVGLNCHSTLFNETEICDFCPLEDLNEHNESRNREYFHDHFKKYYEYTEKLIKWPDGRIVLLRLGRDIQARKQNENELKTYREKLEKLVEERTQALEKANSELAESINEYEESQRALSYLLEDVNDSREELLEINRRFKTVNKELEAFSYSVSHDLKAPLRAIDGFSRILEEDYADKLDDEAQDFIKTIRENAAMMNNLIQDLLQFSRLSRKEMQKTDLNMTALAQDSFAKLKSIYKDHSVEFELAELPTAKGDRAMVKQVFANLISNAFKYSSQRPEIMVEVGTLQIDGIDVYFVKDNGVGFNMKYADKLFGVFQRLHSAGQFEGTGVGLAIVKRIITKHGGDVWAEAELDKGAAFYFTLTSKSEQEISTG